MNSALSNFVNQMLPVASSSNLSYNASRNMYLTQGYTSGMGHTYFQGIQLSDRVAVVYNVGRGGYGSNPLFLNGVTVYCFDGKDKKLIGSWSPASWEFYSDSLARRVATELLFNYLQSQVKLQGSVIDTSVLKDFADAQIKAAVEGQAKLIA